MAVRWGIVSAGLISGDFTTVLRTLPRSEHQVVAVAARDLSRAKEFARKHDIPKAYGSYEELAKDPNVGVDDTVTVLLQYPGGVHGSFTCSITAQLCNTAYVSGTKGMAQILDPCWCPTELVVKGEHKEFPLPSTPNKEFHFTNGAGMTYEARHVRECLRKGLKESPVIPLAESELLADILEEVRKAIGVTFPQDKH
ncbi:dihydrodiol dehydrogenase [Phyllostomus discolor]|uniref:Dihydrodiol dehydrogenase n=1 Tax=Phyllostomus discolor TaxID=89673 RepID=A0A833YNM6_9CHIR|nr:dihydrodiol dehydrogenase [Phyllostomus discolor]